MKAAVIAVGVLLILSPVAWAETGGMTGSEEEYEEYGYPYYGWGMMGPGMMGGYGMGYGMGMGHGMMGYGMWPGMGIGGCMMDVYEPEFQKFLDETREIRRDLHMKAFDYTEALRKPDAKPDAVAKLRKEIKRLAGELRKKAPRWAWGCFF